MALIVKKFGGSSVADAAKVLNVAKRIVEDYKKGKEKAIMSIFGKCMKELKGNCDPQVLNKILREYVSKL